MPDVYGVAHGDVSAELPGLFPVGFTADTVPTDDQVTGWISTYDTIAELRVRDVAGSNPAAGDKASVLAKRYIIEATKGEVIRTVYTGNDIERVEQAVRPHTAAAKAFLAELETLGAQAVGPGDASPRIRTESSLPTRDLLVTDEQLDTSSHRHRVW